MASPADPPDLLPDETYQERLVRVEADRMAEEGTGPTQAPLQG